MWCKRFPALAGAGRLSMDDVSPAARCEAVSLPEEPSLTYSEIGEALCRCVDGGVVTMEQAQAIGNHLFPVRSH
ncbi:MAG TPA: hypothetical protein DCY27_00365 [Desulfobacterales bacterium]|nr:hypothetical protein [Desulfobacterales bacterium]